MPVMMSGEDFVVGYERFYGVFVFSDDRRGLVELLDRAPRGEVFFFNLFLGMAKAVFGSYVVRAKTERDGTGERFVILVQWNPKQQRNPANRLERLRDEQMAEFFKSPEALRIVIRAEEVG